MRYKLSFSAGSLLVPESVRTAELYHELKDWDKVKQVVIEDNVIQKVRAASVIRMLREIRHRLSTLTDAQFNLFVDSDPKDQVCMLYLAACKYYRILRDFVAEVVREKVLTFDTLLTHADYDRFFDGKCIDHEELLGLSTSSAAKMRQVIWRILAEANLIDSTRSGIITPFMPSRKIMQAVVSDDRQWLKMFLMSDTDISRQEL